MNYEDEEEQIDCDTERYFNAVHAMQSGVAYEMVHGSDDTKPKHLRVGVNSALVDSAALANLLIAKGIITRGEHMKALADEMEAEVKRYEERAGIHIKFA